MTINDFKQKAEKAIEHYQETLKTLRTGRATPSVIEDMLIDAYGSKMPLMQLATISAPEPRVLSISVWDKAVVDPIVEAIKNSDLGVNPNVDTNLIRLNFPQLTEDRRRELTKVVGKYAEECKISLRNIRREFMDDLKLRAKDQNLPENTVKSEEENVDKEIKLFNDKVDQIGKTKEQELMTL